MTKSNLNVLALAIGLAFSASAMAQAMTQEQYKSGKKVIAAEYKIANSACASFSGNAKDICQAEANGKAKVQAAQLNANYLPSENASYKVRVAQAEADYLVAKQQCDDKAGSVKDICVQEAKAAALAAKADAKAQKAINAAHVSAKEKCDALAGDAKGNCIKDASARFGKS